MGDGSAGRVEAVDWRTIHAVIGSEMDIRREQMTGYAVQYIAEECGFYRNHDHPDDAHERTMFNARIQFYLMKQAEQFLQQLVRSKERMAVV